jgi:hypothetical protein
MSSDHEQYRKPDIKEMIMISDDNNEPTETGPPPVLARSP